MGPVHHRPKIAMGRKPTWRRWIITAGIRPWMTDGNSEPAPAFLFTSFCAFGR